MRGTRVKQLGRRRGSHNGSSPIVGAPPLEGAKAKGRRDERGGAEPLPCRHRFRKINASDAIVKCVIRDNGGYSRENALFARSACAILVAFFGDVHMSRMKTVNLRENFTLRYIKFISIFRDSIL